MNSTPMDELAEQILEHIRESVSALNRYSMTPGLAIVTAGDSPEAAWQAGQIASVARESGFHVRQVHLTPDISLQTAKQFLNELAMDEQIHGVVLATPLRFDSISENDVMALVDELLLHKDAAMVCSENLGELMTGQTGDIPPFAMAIMLAISSVGDQNGERTVPVGKRVVIVSGNEVFSSVMSRQFRLNSCLVVTAKPNVPGLEDEIAEADIVITAAGIPNLFDRTDLSADSIVVNAGLAITDGEPVPDVSTDGTEDWNIVSLPMPGATDRLSVAALLYRVILLACRYGRKPHYIPLMHEFVEEILNPVQNLFD